VRKPRALDLFCCAGGATKGLQQAGFHVTGVDIRPQPRYCGDEFHQADALTFKFSATSEFVGGSLDHYPEICDRCGLHWDRHFDFAWASPPCQAYTVSRTRVARDRRREHPKLIEPMRIRLQKSGVAWVMENVLGAPLWFPLTLCGGAFGLGATCEDGVRRPLRRHRLFECWQLIMGPGCHCNGIEKIGVYGNGGGWANRFDPDRRGYKGCVAESREAMGIDWMTIAELSEAIPPAYSRFIGEQVLRLLAQPETPSEPSRGRCPAQV